MWGLRRLWKYYLSYWISITSTKELSYCTVARWAVISTASFISMCITNLNSITLVEVFRVIKENWDTYFTAQNRLHFPFWFLYCTFWLRPTKALVQKYVFLTLCIAISPRASLLTFLFTFDFAALTPSCAYWLSNVFMPPYDSYMSSQSDIQTF